MKPDFTTLFDGNLDSAFATAIRRGMMSQNQYSYIAERIITARPCTLLVFGIGHDADLWGQCAEGKVAYVEDNPTFLTMAPATSRVLMYEFASRVGVWMKVPMPPLLIAQRWDYVLVDGPRGYDRCCPGRQIPFTWAKQLADRQIFVHDYERA